MLIFSFNWPPGQQATTKTPRTRLVILAEHNIAKRVGPGALENQALDFYFVKNMVRYSCSSCSKFNFFHHTFINQININSIWLDSWKHSLNSSLSWSIGKPRKRSWYQRDTTMKMPEKNGSKMAATLWLLQAVHYTPSPNLNSNALRR